MFHRYALQPWADVRPGMTMGPWGVHYERTQTWWDWTMPWHDYLARCQLMLRQGRFVADICYLQAEAPPQGFHDHPRAGYHWDECSAEVVLTRMTVRDGRLVLPDDMSYRLLVLPESPTMTPALLGKIKDLVEAGATVVGSRPVRSPSLSGYPKCDESVKRLADELWGDCDGQKVKEHCVGRGRICCGTVPEALLAKAGVRPDFTSRAVLRYIHRKGGDTDLYFVANPLPSSLTAVCSFRVTGKQPELWWLDTGHVEAAAMFTEQDDATSVSVPLGPSGSVFVVFRKHAEAPSSIVSVTHDGKAVLSTSAQRPSRIAVRKAVYGVLSDPLRTRDVRAKVQQIVDAGEDRFEVARLAAGDDPAFGIVKTLVVDYSIDDLPGTARGTDPETIVLASVPAPQRIADVRRDPDGHLLLEAWKPGHYELQTAAGRRTIEVSSLPGAMEVKGPWEVAFSPGHGAPERTTFDQLVAWSQHADPGVKYFSGTASYTRTLSVPVEMLGRARRLYLDLGEAEVMAHVTLNGKDLGVLWKPPFLVDITEVARPGANALEVKVVNLWINRMIGDEQLPEDSQRNPNGTLKEWPQWLSEGKSSPTGRYTFTSWRLWKKGDALVPSGLLGPVRLLAIERVNVD